MSAEHDPLCPELKYGDNADMDWPSECACELIARVRADEQANAIPMVAALLRAAGGTITIPPAILHDPDRPTVTRIKNPDRSITFTASPTRIVPGTLLEPAEPQIESQIIRAITRGPKEARDG